MLNVLVLVNSLNAKLASDQRKGLSTKVMCLAATTNQLVTLAPLVLCGSVCVWGGGEQGRDGGLWLSGPSSFLVLAPRAEYVPEPC